MYNYVCDVSPSPCFTKNKTNNQNRLIIDNGEPFISVSWKGENFRALIDTGCNHTLVSSNFLARYAAEDLKHLPFTNKVSATVANGQSIEYVSKVKFPLRVASYVINISAYLYPNCNYDMVLGTNQILFDNNKT
jgi:hypothetical protein